MRYAILILSAMSPAISSCASTSRRTVAPTSGVTAIYSPPVRLGGSGSMIFLPAPARNLLPSPPSADYLPGPWSIYFVGNSGRPRSETREVIEQIAVMAKHYPSVGVLLCAIGPSRSDPMDDRDGQRLDAVRVLLGNIGVRKIRTRTDQLCRAMDRGSEPTVRVEPMID